MAVLTAAAAVSISLSAWIHARTCPLQAEPSPPTLQVAAEVAEPTRVEEAEAEAYAAETEEPDAAAMEADEVESLRAERDDMRDRFMRALADAENARKRADKERRDAEAYGGTRLSRDLLPVYDNLNRALAALDVQGVITNRGFLQRLTNHPDFQAAHLDTRFIERHEESLFASTHPAEPAPIMM